MGKRQRGTSLRKRVQQVPQRNAQSARVHYRHEVVNQDRAHKILEGQVHNRRVDESLVERYARDMRSGQWRSTGETLKFNAEGKLMDGQHRLWAFIYSGLREMYFDIAYDVPEEAMLVMDTGRKRNFGDYLRIQRAPNYSTLAAAVRWVWWFENRAPGDFSSAARCTHSEFDALLALHPQLADAVATVVKSKAGRVIHPGVMCFVFYYANQDNPELAREWLDRVAGGERLTKEDPCYMLRDRIFGVRATGLRMQAMTIAALAVKSWNAFRQQRHVKKLRWAQGEDFPLFVHYATFPAESPADQ